MLRGAFVAGWILACGLLAGGCLSVPNMVNYAAADAMDYDRLAANARERDPELSSAIKRISKSSEHQRVQAILADLPSDMDACLVIEMAQLNESDEIIPAMLAMFVSGESIGFLSNFAFNAEDASAPRGGEWRVAVWPAPVGVESILPEDPAELLPSALAQETKPSKSAVIILTLVNRERILTLAIWDEGTILSPRDRMVRYLPRWLPESIRRAAATGEERDNCFGQTQAAR